MGNPVHVCRQQVALQRHECFNIFKMSLYTFISGERSDTSLVLSCPLKYQNELYDQGYKVTFEVICSVMNFPDFFVDIFFVRFLNDRGR